MISTSIGWTVGLLGMSLIISWLLGILLGSLVGYFPNRWMVAGVGELARYRLPGALFHPGLCTAHALYLLLANIPTGWRRQWNAAVELGVSSAVCVQHSFLPALSIVIGGTAFRFIMAKALASTETSSDYVQYAEIAAVSKMQDFVLVCYPQYHAAARE